jgi:membrane fusion protein (multidrug efflux system)
MPPIPTVRPSSILRPTVLLFGLALLAACGKHGGDPAAKDGSDKAPDPIVVEVATVARRPIVASYAGTAPLDPTADAQVIAKTSGVALQVLVEEGQEVKVGQVLARLDPARAELQLAQANAQLRKLEADFQRSQSLARQQLISASDFDTIRFNLANARATADMARLELSYAAVRSPIAGVLAQRMIKPGNFVQINTPIFRVVDTSRLEATLNVPERDVERIRAGMPAVLTVDALPGQQFQGTVNRVAPVVDAGSGTFRVICAFGGDRVLQPGMFGRIAIAYDRKAEAIAIPRSALLDDADGSEVFVVEQGKAKRVSLQTGTQDGPWLEVLKGLSPGQQVVVAGKAALRDGSAVQVLAPDRGGNAAPTVPAAASAAAPR